MTKMRISSIKVQSEGYVHCKSNFYSAHDCMSNGSCHTFLPGINTLMGEIDSGNWAISYLLSMYVHRPEDFVLFGQPQINVNNNLICLDELAPFSCYLDELDPLFSVHDSVAQLIKHGLQSSHSNDSCEDIRKLFHMDSERFERPLAGVGNEIFKAMAAIGYANDKKVFCFPWLSKKRFESYHENLTDLLRTLDDLGQISIVPVGMI